MRPNTNVGREDRDGGVVGRESVVIKQVEETSKRDKKARVSRAQTQPAPYSPLMPNEHSMAATIKS